MGHARQWLCRTANNVCCVTQLRLSAVRHSRQCLLRHTADIVCCVGQQTLCVVPHSRHVCCVTQQTLSAVSHGRHVCCVTQQTGLLCAVSRSRPVCCVTELNPCKNVTTFFWASANSQAGRRQLHGLHSFAPRIPPCQ